METPEIVITESKSTDLEKVLAFLEPYMNGRHLLKRTSLEMELLLRHSFMALVGGELVGFCALEIYSKKLAELQCLAVAEDYRRMGIGKQLVRKCVERAHEEKVKELMAISSSSEMFKACGFQYSLPNQKRALFISP